MAFKYWLPNTTGEKEEFETNARSLIIIGANGSGKSKLGAWIEQQDYDQVHRIGAQRNLNFNENISLKSYSQAEDFVFFGTDDKTQHANKTYRWDWGKSYTTKLMDDFENVLAALIGLKNDENDHFILEYKTAKENNSDLPSAPETVVDKLKAIWAEVLPERELIVEDSKFYALFEKDGNKIKYSANQMSDGERAVLYLAAQVLCVPKNKTLIIDEPEVHLHRSIMNRLWILLEKYRTDCLFIFMTHDTQFAALHSNAEKIWIKEYDGNNWKLEKINSVELPEELLFEILGSRKNILFVEGEINSYDTKLYSEIFNDFYVVACGSCTQVISRTKAFRHSESLHSCEVYGIIDRDYRSENEIKSYEMDGIYTLKVAEVENLFIVEELIRFMAERMAKEADKVFDKIKEYVIKTRFRCQIQKQICQSVVARIKYMLNCLEISNKNNDEAKETLNTALASINYDAIRQEQEKLFQAALDLSDYSKVIKIFNEKNIAKSIGVYIGIQNNDYCDTVISLLQQSDCRDEIINSLLHYFPEELIKLRSRKS